MLKYIRDCDDFEGAFRHPFFSVQEFSEKTRTVFEVLRILLPTVPRVCSSFSRNSQVVGDGSGGGEYHEKRP